MSKIDKLEPTLDLYIQKYFCCSNAKPKISVIYTSGDNSKADCCENSPESALPGVYVIFGEDDTILYIGSSYAGKGVGTRLVSYRTNPKLYDPRLRVQIITVAHRYEAASLELWLIARLGTARNVYGTRDLD